MAERALKKVRGNTPVTIVRPSIIICCYNDPFIGWIDSPAASGSIAMTVQFGILHLVYSRGNAIID